VVKDKVVLLPVQLPVLVVGDNKPSTTTPKSMLCLLRQRSGSPERTNCWGVWMAGLMIRLSIHVLDSYMCEGGGSLVGQQ
jgi:hypothetical protein